MLVDTKRFTNGPQLSCMRTVAAPGFSVAVELGVGFWVAACILFRAAGLTMATVRIMQSGSLHKNSRP